MNTPHSTSMIRTPLSQVLQSLRATGEGWTALTGEDWSQGRSLFGGLQAALAAQAMRTLVPEGMPLRALQTTFIAPVPAGPVDVKARRLRVGKNVVHVEGRLVQGEECLCLVIGVYGAARTSSVELMPPAPVEALKPRERPFIPGVTPNFNQHFAIRWLRGGLPYSGAREAEQLIEMDLLDSGAVGDAQVLAFADVIPPVALSMLREPAPGSSLTWMIEFLAERFDGLPLQGWRMDMRLEAARNGYTTQAGVLWGPGGAPIAASRQSMVVFG